MTIDKDSFIVKDIEKAYLVTGDLIIPDNINIVLDKPLFVNGNIFAFGDVTTTSDLHCSESIVANRINVPGILKSLEINASHVYAKHVEVVSSSTIGVITADTINMIGKSAITISIDCSEIFSGSYMVARDITCNVLSISGVISLSGICNIEKVLYKESETSFVGISSSCNSDVTIFESIKFSRNKKDGRETITLENI